MTRAAAAAIAEIHDRMPLVLHPAAWNMWIDRTRKTLESVNEVLVQHSVSEVQAYKISTKVNTPRNRGPDVLDPID